MSGTKIFLSYAAVDRTRVEVLVKALESQGLDVWWDRDIPRGKNFNRVIEEALEQARCAIVIWSRASIASEWVFNEASEARKRDMLVPVLIDNVEPPLEFRHLQAARLIDWHGDAADTEWTGLLEAVQGLVQQVGGTQQAGGTQTDRVVAEVPMQQDRRGWWQTPAGMALGAGALLAGLSLLVITLKHVGLIGGAAPSSPTATSPATSPAAAVQTPITTQPPAAMSAAHASQATVQSKPANSVAATNLLDPEQGAKLLIASESNWKDVMQRELRSTVIGSHGFAVFAFRDEQPAVIEAVGVYVESTNASNLKELVVYAGDQSERGPFRKIAQVTLPNYRNMRAPMHEFKVDPFTARYVKFELVSWQHGTDAPNGYVGNLQLLGRLP